MPDLDTPYALKDPLEVVRDVIREGFRSGRVQSPGESNIDLRAHLPDLRVENGDFVSFYEGGDMNPQAVGARHDDERVPIKIDIRSAYRDRALELKWAIREVLDVECINPGQSTEWSELRRTAERVVSSYDGNGGRGGYTHIVIDVELRKHLRQRPLPRVMGGRVL